MGKKVKKHWLRSTLSVLLCSLIVVLGAGLGIASAATSGVNNSTNTLKISPTRTDVTVQPGTSAKVSTFLSNLTNTPIVVHPIENDFVAGDEKGTPAVILDENSYAPTHSLKRFMVPLQNIMIPAGQTQQVDVTLTVPKSAQAGGYFGALRFAPASATGGKSVNLSASVASLILMTVPGPTTEKLDMTNFDIQQDGATGSNFRTPDDISVLLRFQNKGNLQEAPFGQIYVQKGDKVVYKTNFNQSNPKDNVLPDSARRWEVPLKGFGKFGKYKVGATITYGVNSSQSITVSKTVWIVPTTYIIAGIVIIIILLLLIFGFWAFLRSYKRRILRGSSYRSNRRR